MASRLGALLLSPGRTEREQRDSVPTPHRCQVADWPPSAQRAKLRPPYWPSATGCGSP